MAGCDAGGHAASGHRADRAQAAGDASPRLPEELHQGGSIDGLRVSEGIDRAEGGVGYLVPGSQEGEGHRADAAAGRDRPCRRRRVRRHLWHHLWLHRGRIHQSRVARLCRGYPLAAAAGAGCRQGEPDRRPARAHLHSVLARQAGRLRAHPRLTDGGAAGAEHRRPVRRHHHRSGNNQTAGQRRAQVREGHSRRQLRRRRPDHPARRHRRGAAGGRRSAGPDLPHQRQARPGPVDFDARRRRRARAGPATSSRPCRS